MPGEERYATRHVVAPGLVANFGNPTGVHSLELADPNDGILALPRRYHGDDEPHER
jgi:hypothetical protein